MSISADTENTIRVCVLMPPRAEPVSVFSRRVTADLSEPESVHEPRRSQRPRRPSARQVESDEYEASQRSGLSESQLKPAPRDKLKKHKKPGRGNRPGIIVQPATDFGPTSHKRSKAPASAAGFDIGGSRMASPAIGNAAPKTVDRAQAVRSASAILGADASKYSMSTLKQIIASGEAVRQDDTSDAMEIERGNLPALQQPTRQMGLASRQQSPNGGAAVQSDESQLAGALEESQVVPPDDNTNTEPSSDPDPIRPEDSVSQRVPPVPGPSRPLQTMSVDPIRNTHPRSYLNDGSQASSNTEPDEETVRSLKRQRTEPPLPVRLSQSKDSHSRPNSLSWPSISSIPQRIPPSRPQSSSLSYEPPPASNNLGAVLSWAARFAKQAAASQHVRGASQSNTNYNLLATVLDDLRHSPNVASAPRAPTNSHRARNAQEDAAVREAQEVLALNKKTTRKRLTLQDFPGFDGHVATLIIPKLIATSIAQGPFGEHDVQIATATKLFNTRWPREFPNIQVPKPPYPLMSLITHRISWARGQARNRIRPVIPSDYNLINPPRTREDIQHNRDLIKSCLPNAFHCSGLQADICPYEHKALSHCIAAAFFWATDSVGMTYHHLYYPMPLPTVATTLTKMQHCLSEWKTGRYVPKELNVDKQRRIYEAHLAGLVNVGKEDPGKLRDMQINWFWYAVDYAGGSIEEEDPVQPVTWAGRVSDGELDLHDGEEASSDSDADD
ncbi:hypothetical protein RhiJN_24491 [Ceratobasidium sp. AG-Ba]|nr:hypothetical protein RhiJN_24491 [Ceratobasidium sp. AG-Ba]